MDSPVGDAADDPVADLADHTPSDCARRLLETLRAEGDPAPYRRRLAAYGDDALAAVRTDRETALAFWINLYNAGTQLLLARRPELYASRLRSLRFFGARALTVAGQGLSLDDVEHGLLRGKASYGLGYLPRLFPGRFERRYRLAEPDPRVHFALNCGAASCPAIRSYDPDRIDDQLDLATRVYLDATVEYDPETGTATVPRLFLWYRGDFGGGDGIRSLLREYDAVPADAAPRLQHRGWDWTREAKNFVD
jgi:hypothetical protein